MAKIQIGNVEIPATVPGVGLAVRALSEALADGRVTPDEGRKIAAAIGACVYDAAAEGVEAIRARRGAHRAERREAAADTRNENKRGAGGRFVKKGA